MTSILETLSTTFATIVDTTPLRTLLSVDPWSQEPLIISLIVVGFLIAFILAFAVGANDVANSFGTSVGAKVLTLRQACIMAVIFESLGAVLIGGRVSDTIWRGIVDLGQYAGEERVVMLGEIAALISAAVWLMIATFMKIPVSGTHSIVGATMGFSLVKKGTHGMKWETLGQIVASWFASPIAAGIVSAGFFLLIRRFILQKDEHLEPALRAMPAFYSLAIFVNCLSIFLGGSSLLGLDKLPPWGAVILSFGLAVVTAILVHFIVVPRQRKQILERTIELSQVANGVGVGTEDLPGHYNRHGRLHGIGGGLSALDSVSPSVTSSIMDLRTPKYKRKQQQHDMSTSTGGGFLSLATKGIRRPTMSASTSMTGLANMGALSRATSAIVLAKTSEEPSLPSVAEHHDEHDGGITLEVPVLLVEVRVDMEENGNRNDKPFHNLNIKNGILVTPSEKHSISIGPDTPAAAAAETIEPLLNRVNGPIQEEVRISPDLSSGPAYAGMETPIGSEGPDRKISVVESVKSSSSKRTAWEKLAFWRPQDRQGDASQSPRPVDDKKECCPTRRRRRSHSKHRVKDPPEVHAIFSYLQILTAGFTAFAHGGNDVCNAIGPLVALWVIYDKGKIPGEGTHTDTNIWLLLFGGFGISVGLSILGRKVIETVGTNLTPVIPSSGFCIGMGTACTVLVASKIGLPISTTHCIVGSVVSVGWLRNSSQVNFRLFRTIIFGWFVTLPVTVGVSAAAMAILSSLILGQS